MVTHVIDRPNAELKIIEQFARVQQVKSVIHLQNVSTSQLHRNRNVQATVTVLHQKHALINYVAIHALIEIHATIIQSVVLFNTIQLVIAHLVGLAIHKHNVTNVSTYLNCQN